MTELECRAILDLPTGYTLSDAKKAYRKKVLETHPDKNRGDATLFVKVNRAYEEIQIYLQNRNRSSSYTYNRDVYNQRVKAEQKYKERVKQDLFWKKYEEAKRKKYETDYKENLKIGFLIVAIIVLVCVYLGYKFDPEFKYSEKDKIRYDEK